MVRFWWTSGAAAFAVVVCTSAVAQSAGDLEAKLNGSGLCAPLKYDAIDIARLQGYEVPDIGVQMEVGWDEDAHKVRAFAVAAGKLTAELELGCKPGPTSAVILDMLDIEAGDLRLSVPVTCAGTVATDGTIVDLDCKPKGRIERIVAGIADLSGQLKPSFGATLVKH